MKLVPGKLYECIQGFEIGNAEDLSYEKNDHRTEAGTILMFIKSRNTRFGPRVEEEFVFLYKKQIIVSRDRFVDQGPEYYFKEIGP
jgi:hypothetical protein